MKPDRPKASLEAEKWQSRDLLAVLAGINSDLTHQIMGCPLPKRKRQLEAIRLCLTQAYNLEMLFQDWKQ